MRGFTIFWPADNTGGPVSRNALTIQDLTAYVAGNNRAMYTYPPMPGFSARLDIVPGPGVFASTWINLHDLVSIVIVKPPMAPYFGAIRAFGGPPCHP